MPLGIVDTVGGDLPLPIGGGSAVGVSPSDVDVLVDRIPFWLAIGADASYERMTAPFQREQIDQQPEAGEQSLAGWWMRSQMSFHYGAGLDYLDTTARPAEEDRLRFKTSRNIDVWTPGQVSRLNGTELSAATAPSGEQVWIEATDGLLIVASESEVQTWNGTAWTARDHGSAFPIRAFTIDGENYYAATIDGVWTAPIAGTAVATKLWNLPSTDVPMCLGWVKQRLMLGHGTAVYSLDSTPPTLPSAQLTHPVASWRWTAFSDSPGGILAAGYAGLTSGIFAFALEDVSGTPTLGAGVALISLPGGERVLSTLFYLSSLLVLGTNRGVRVCPFDSFYGTMSLGPLVVETEAPVTALGGYDRYVWAGTQVAGETSLVRVDLSTPLDNSGHYAWAPDLVFPDDGTWTDDVTAIAFLADGRKAIGVDSRGVVFESDGTNPSEAAWLETARIRMGTVEDKHWIYSTLRGIYSEAAPIGISLLYPDIDDFVSIHVATENRERFTLGAPRAEWIALRFDLAEGAEMSSYQVQAQPAGERQRLISLPVWVTDSQLTRSGIEVGYPGWALSRLSDIEELERDGGEVTVSAPALFTEAVRGVIEKLTFIQPYNPGDQGGGTGGVLQIMLRTTA